MLHGAWRQDGHAADSGRRLHIVKYTFARRYMQRSLNLGAIQKSECRVRAHSRETASNANCALGIMLMDDQFIIAPRGSAGGFTPSDALGSVAELPCPINDLRVQEAVADVCQHCYWPECFMTVALKATPQKGRAAPILVTWGSLRPFDPEGHIYPMHKVLKGFDKLTGLPASAQLGGFKPNFKFTLGL